jgi:phosphatidylglycerophosphate synthase
VIFCPDTTASLRIAGLTLADRLIVAAHRAGASPITVVSPHALPDLQRTRALGIPIEVKRRTPETPVPVLMASAEVLVQAADLRRCLLRGARLVSSSGKPLPVGVARTEPALDQTPPLQAEGVALSVKDRGAARSAEAELWSYLVSSSDGWVDKVFNRPCGRPLSKLLVHTRVSPNSVSIVSILIGLVSALCFAQGQQPAAIVGALLFQLSAIIDCVDGDLARILFKESRFGKWLDLAGDQLVHVSVFGGIALGILKTDADSNAQWLALSAVTGALISFAVVVRGMGREASQNQALQRLVDRATNRDFSVLVLLLACLQQLKVFLWMAAVGSHLFWVAALSLQYAAKSSRRSS